ncbi:MAG: LuxR C-terminal-related transcriptional regulator [Sandaracinaceae bacterium]|nr:LuxR C-terminal-related transcriptional regulator [Sandaracinaceae bacterium]
MRSLVAARAARALADAPVLDDVARERIWRAFMAGEIRVAERRSAGASVVFLARARPEVARAALDARARAVAELVGAGLAYKEVAFQLGISNASVWRAIAAACRVMGLAHRMDLAILAAALGPHRGAADHRCVRCARAELAGAELLALEASVSASPIWDRLSDAERAVTELALAGHGDEAIARLRGARSPRTVANQLDHVFRKAGVSGRVQLVTRLVAG